jgi:hypothetical protein
MTGSGSATVVTPAFYRPGSRFRVTVGSRSLLERASGAGRLTIDVRLGPSNTVQDYPLNGSPIGTRVFTTRVTIALAPR